jgi:5-methylcytosine-specific restriction protein A
MPTAAPRPCHVPTCPALVTARTPCPRHPVLAPWQRQAPRGRGYRWQRRRAAQLRAQPLCALCYLAGRTRYAEEVDHVVPLRAGGGDIDDNLQSICRACHAEKTAAEWRAQRG